MQKGLYVSSIKMLVSTFSGFIQFHSEDFEDKRSLDQSMSVSEEGFQ